MENFESPLMLNCFTKIFTFQNLLLIVISIITGQLYKQGRSCATLEVKVKL